MFNIIARLLTAVLSALSLAVCPATVTTVTSSEVICASGDGQEWAYYADAPELSEGDTVVLVFCGDAIIASL